MRDGPHVLVIFYSRYGVVRRLAEWVAEGARRVEGAKVELLEVEDQPIEELRPGESEGDMLRRRAALVNRLTSADALIVGAPGYFGSMASPVKRLFEDCATAPLTPGTDRSRPWRHHLFRNKLGAAFTATGTPHGGNEETLRSILTMFIHLGMIVVTPGQQQPILENESAPYGATAISGPKGTRMPTKAEEETARNLGQQVAEETVWIRRGQERWVKRENLKAEQRQLGENHPF